MPRLGRALLSRSLTLAAAPLLVVAVLSAPPPAAAHEERPASFPDGSGTVPRFLGWDNPRQRVVCTAASARLVEQMPAGAVRDRNERLLERCDFRSIQSAINSIDRPRTSVYVLPGVYREQRWAEKERSDYCSNLATSSRTPLEDARYIGSVTAAGPEDDGRSDPVALSYADQRRCPHNLNLIAVFGDRTPKNDSIACDSRFCGTQIVGTGREMTDVVIDNRFQKLNALRLDRADGALVHNLTAQKSEFNAIYVLETDGFVLDRVTARANDEYGILAFASDHGLIQHSDTYYNGDSGIYPGSASDLNSDNPDLEVTRYAVEIRHNRSHHNALGYSGTAGNSVWAHHNDFDHNATGIATDSLFPDHPGLPQDHARWSRNRIFSNNENYYARYVDTGVCERPMAKRGYMKGTVCPVIPTPVGTGVLIAGGNFNSTDHNWIYDNWRYGTMQFWVPAALRDEMDPDKQEDTSHHNHTVDNVFGVSPSGEVAHNGLDHWWDDQGEGNCWQDNEYSRGERTDNFTVPPPSCDDGGSIRTPGAPVKDAGFLSCSEYDRNDPEFRHPPGCTWFDDPERPDSSGDPGTAGSAAGATATAEPDALVAAPWTALAGVVVVLALLRRRRARAS